MIGISIHSPHTRGDRFGRDWHEVGCRFQSTPLIRGETGGGRGASPRETISIHSPHTRGDFSPFWRFLRQKDFNPLPSYEGRLDRLKDYCESNGFQSTPLIRGETVYCVYNQNDLANFNPLPSYEGRQGVVSPAPPAVHISIHSPHTRGDVSIHL